MIGRVTGLSPADPRPDVRAARPGAPSPGVRGRQWPGAGDVAWKRRSVHGCRKPRSGCRCPNETPRRLS